MEVEKINKYAADCSRLNLNFHHPLVLDAYGGIPPSTVHHVLSPLPSTGSRTLSHPTGQHHQPRPTGTRGSLCDPMDLFNVLKSQASVWHLLGRVMSLHLRMRLKYFLIGKQHIVEIQTTHIHFKLNTLASSNTQTLTSTLKHPCSTWAIMSVTHSTLLQTYLSTLRGTYIFI